MEIAIICIITIFVFGLYADWNSEPEASNSNGNNSSIEYFSVKKGA